MTSATYTFDHYMGDDYTVTRVITLTVRRGGVARKRYGKTTFFRARFPRLLAWQIGRRLRREGYSRAPEALYAEWFAEHSDIRSRAATKSAGAEVAPYVPFGRWIEARSAAHGPALFARRAPWIGAGA